MPKNLKFLVGMDGAQVIQVMRGFDAALGTQCVFCHVGEDFANDEKPAKATALMMLMMTRDVNSHFTDGKQHVTCYTCHRGSTEPAMQPPPAAEGEKH